ncbi:MAG: hypothetical protein V1907_01565 [Candidatus Kerfeldbacteria bacterium]
MANSSMNPRIDSSVKTESKTGTLTRVITFIALGVSAVAIVAAIFVVKGPSGSSGKTTSPSADPLKVMQVFSWRLVYENGASFIPLDFYGGNTKLAWQYFDGTNVQWQMGSGASLLPTPAALKIVTPSATPGFGNLLLHLEYFDVTDPTVNLNAPGVNKYLTVCIGATNATTVYVGTDGSTYLTKTGNKLYDRITTKSCPDIIAQSLDMLSISEVSTTIMQFPDNAAVRFSNLKSIQGLVRAVNGFQQGWGSSPQDPWFFPQPYSPHDPLMLEAANDYRKIGTFTVPAAMYGITGKDINGADLTVTACVPDLKFTGSYNLGTGPFAPRVFLRNDGQPFYDPLLIKPAISASCATAKANSLKFSSITSIDSTVFASGQFPSNATMRFANAGFLNAAIIPPGGYSAGVPAVVTPYDDPLMVFAQNGMRTPGLFTIPVGTVIIVGKDAAGAAKTVSACIPELRYTTSATAMLPPYPHVYISKDGKPYSDVFLTTAVPCSVSGKQKISD